MGIAALFQAYLFGNPVTAGHQPEKLDGMAFANALEALVGSGVPQWRVRRALAATSAATLTAVAAAVPADPTDPVNIAWNCGAPVDVGSVLYVFIQSTLGWTTSQMTTLMVSAAATAP